MKVITLLPELRAARELLPEPVGLVPTMGALHLAHLSLVRQAQAQCASVVVSIFVNPSQFGPAEDLDSYPRPLESDLEMLADAGVDLVWTPTVDVMYPPQFQTWIEVENLTNPLEGAHRPGHFRGVTTVVAKLFIAVLPQRAYFGQKDAQQVAVLRQMARDLNMPLQIAVCPIVREADGLAMSSRNAHLNPAERTAAAVLNRALTRAGDAYAGGETGAEQLRRLMAEAINGEPLARLQYVSCAHPDTLAELDGPVAGALLSMAVFIGKTRLIDNRLIGEHGWVVESVE